MTTISHREVVFERIASYDIEDIVNDLFPITVHVECVVLMSLKNKEHKKSAENSALFLLCKNDEIIVEWIFAVLGNKSSVSRKYSAL